MELVFLGTGSGIPAKERNVSSIALNLSAERGTTWLFDCGEATQHQILYTAIKPRKIEKIFITHLHGDHIFGLPGLLGSRSFQDGDSLLTIYGPKGIREFIEVSLMVSQTHLKYELDVVEVYEGIVYIDDKFVVEAKKLEHGVECFGFRITERDLPGSLQVDRLKEIGVPPGPLYQKLKNGERVVLDDGTILQGNDFLGPEKKGRKLAILGDTRFTDSAIPLAQDVDVLVHEATFSAEDEKLAYSYFHSTTTQAAKIASKANVKNLVLTHMSSRYQGVAVKKLLEEASQIFPNTQIAKDFMTYVIDR